MRNFHVSLIHVVTKNLQKGDSWTICVCEVQKQDHVSDGFSYKFVNIYDLSNADIGNRTS